MNQEKGKQRAIDPKLIPAPLFSSRTHGTTQAHIIPHLVDVDLDLPGGECHQNDDILWNSMLEEKGEEPVPEWDALGKVHGVNRAHWVKMAPSGWANAVEILQAQDKSSAPAAKRGESNEIGGFLREDEIRKTPKQGFSAPKDFAFEERERTLSLPITDSAFQPATTNWSPRSVSKRARRESWVYKGKKQGRNIHGSADVFIGQAHNLSAPESPYPNRGGGVELPSEILSNITDVTQTDPIRHHNMPVTYEPRPSIRRNMDVDEEKTSNTGNAHVPPNFSIPSCLWAGPPPPRPGDTTPKKLYMPLSATYGNYRLPIVSPVPVSRKPSPAWLNGGPIDNRDDICKIVGGGECNALGFIGVLKETAGYMLAERRGGIEHGEDDEGKEGS
ncbi:hypothetical protein N0V90_012779 [Kalmusia sp. IMI 367209]|nr:hypothetical protein N0V90_012779 [Kalmusia sp. IMI 367209]